MKEKKYETKKPKKLIGIIIGLLLIIIIIIISVVSVKSCKKEDNTETHNLEYVKQVDATCTTDGILAHYHCSICDKDFSDSNAKEELSSVVINALGHDLLDHPATDATTSTKGNIEYWSCARCNKYFSDSEGKIETDLESVEIPLLHTHNPEHHERVEASCVKDGSLEYYYCSICGLYFTDEACTNKIAKDSLKIEALGHDYSEFVTTVEPTCTTNGEKKKTCSRCNYELIESIPALGHNLVHVDLKAATCTESGNVEYYKCERCNKYYSDNEGKNELTDILLPASGHNLTHVEAKAATCTEKGNIEYYVCSTCNKYFSDSNCTIEIDLNSITVQALGHNLTHHDKVDATTTKTGTIEYWSCSNCNKFFSDSEGTTEVDDIIIPLHTHTLTLMHDSLHHWTGCECGYIEGTKEAHSYSSGICSVCSYNVTSATSIEISSDTTSIPNSAFTGCAKLESVTLPNTITSIGDSAFATAINLKNINIPSSVTEIGDNAFAGTSITSITIPSSVTSIGVSIFSHCTELKTVIIEEGITVISENMFDTCTSLEVLVLPTTITKIDSLAFTECNVDPTNGIAIYYMGSSKLDFENINIADNSNLPSIIKLYSSDKPESDYSSYWHFNSQNTPVLWNESDN